MEQPSEHDKLFEGLPESPRAEPLAPVKRSLARTGILPSQALRSLIASGEIKAAPDIIPDQIQPASLDLRLGKVAYRIRASFLPGPNATVRDKLAELKFHEIDLTQGAVLEAGCVYLVPLIEQLNLRATVSLPTARTVSTRSRKDTAVRCSPRFARAPSPSRSATARGSARSGSCAASASSSTPTSGPDASATAPCAKSTPMSAWSRATPRSAKA
jgi:hypothetical protein